PAGGRAGLPGSWQRLDLDRQNGREVADDRRPVVTGVRRGVDLAAGRAEVDPAGIQRVDGHRVTQDVDVAVLLRQALGQRLPLVAAGPAAVHPQLPFGRVVLGVAGDRDHVHRVGLVRVDVD